MDRISAIKRLRIAIAVIIILTAVMASYNFARSNFQDALIEDVELTEKLEAGMPVYVDFEDIKTGDYNLEYDENSSYSQLEISNVSDETLYDISIELAKQQTSQRNSFLIPSYHISILRSGESALLSTQHENVDRDQPLMVKEVTYRDSEGNAIFISASSDDGKERSITVKPNLKTEFAVLTEDIEKIRTGEITVSEESGQRTARVEITNISDEKLYDVYVNIIEYNEGMATGNIYARLEVLDGGFSRSISIKPHPDTELKISDTGYTLRTEEDKNGHVYSLFPDEGVYRVRAYSSQAAAQSRNTSMTFARLAAIIIFLEANRREAEYRLKGATEGKDEYLKKAGYAAMIKWVTLVIYIILVADLFRI